MEGKIKMKKPFSRAVLACILAATITFSACEPNVDVDENNQNTEDDSLLNPYETNGYNNGTNGDGTEYNNGYDNGTNDYDNNYNDENGYYDENGYGDENGYDDENGYYNSNGNTAAEGEYPAADSYNNNARLLPLEAIEVQSIVSGISNDFNSLPNDKIGWGLGAAIDDKGRPLDALNANRDFGELGAIFIGECEKSIYLTFDEGYENGCTSNILDILKAKNVRATFFVTYDYCEREPALVQRMLDEGHVVGNHSYTHPSFPDSSVDEVRGEIQKLHDYVKQTFDYEMTLIRFPMGEFSKQSLAVAKSLGYTSVFWSFAYMDWNVNNQPEPDVALEKSKSGTHPGGIVLLHAVSQTNAQILGELIDFWHSEGYKLGIVGEKNPSLENMPENVR